VKIEQFEVKLDESMLADLRERLERTPWLDYVEDAGWDYGTDWTYMRELVDYWRTEFDWRAQERCINSFPNFRANIDGWGIHFVHVRGKGPNPLPLIITHGWPSTFYEMLEIIPLLTDPARFGGDPADAFDVVAPSLPGYGFSDRRARREPVKTHDLWAKLMVDGLGYTHFGAQGGDVGAGVTSNLGRYYPENVVGIHLNSDLQWPNPMPDPADLAPAEKDFLQRIEQWDREEGGYSHLQGTKPLTLAYGLNDSPAGLAAYIVEKFRAWSDCGGDIEQRFTKDQLLANVTIYWATRTIYGSMIGYYEGQHAGDRTMPAIGSAGPTGRVETPTGIAMFPKDFYIPRQWAERNYNVRHWTQIDKGGHFAALEEPQLLAEDIREFFRGLRSET
jgi:pimeloyl-ACP methyl ester carboxylesterase